MSNEEKELDETIKGLLTEHFRGHEEELGEYPSPPRPELLTDWDSFLDDLKECPALAFADEWSEFEASLLCP